MFKNILSADTEEETDQVLELTLDAGKDFFPERRIHRGGIGDKGKHGDGQDAFRPGSYEKGREGRR